MILSIIIPVYNAGECVKRCLESVSRLEESNLEIIVINDGSTDDTAMYFKEFKDRDSRFCFIEKENSGVSDTRNYALSIVKGTYVTFVDADDIITEEYNQIIEFIKDNAYDLYSFKYILSTHGKQYGIEKRYLQNGVNGRETLIKEFFAGSLNSVWSNIYKTEIIRWKNLKFDRNVKMGEDLLFNSQYFQIVERVYFINLAPYIYNADNMESAMHNKRVSYLEDYEKIYDELVGIRKKYKGLEIDKGNYLEQVYVVLKYCGRMLTVEQEKKLRSSKLFLALMEEKFAGQWKHVLKKYLIRFRIYKIWVP